MSWMDLYTQSREKLGKEVKTKQDVYDVLSFAVKNKVNADPELKTALINFLTNGLDEYNSLTGYKNGIIPPVQFIQWLSKSKGKKITLQDLEPPNLTVDEAKSFIRENSTGESGQAILRSSLKGFTKYLVTRYKLTRNPFVELKINPTKSKRKIVFNLEQLDEFYNIVMFGAKTIYQIYWKVLLQTGLRPSHAHILKFSDIDRNRPREDAIGRQFYPVYALKALSREKKKKGEIILKKNPPEIAYLSQDLVDEIIKWQTENGKSPDAYIFKDDFAYVALKSFILRNRESQKVKTRLKYSADEYMPYGLRDSWASTLYNISKNLKDLSNLGGWDEEATALNYYVNAFRATEALDIAKRWGIFIPPERADEVKMIEKMKEGTQPDIRRDEVIETMKQQIQTLMTQIAGLEQKFGGVKEPYPVYS